MKLRICILTILTLLSAAPATASDSIPQRHTEGFFRPDAYALRYMAEYVPALDEYTETWLKDRQSHSVAAELRLDTRMKAARWLSRTDSSEVAPRWMEYAREYNWPVFTVGLRYNFNHATTMHRDAADWGEEMEAGYTTHLGDVVTLYGRFDRPLFRSRRFSLGYSMGMGAGYAISCYDKERHIDNELIGAHWNIFFTAGLYADYLITPHWALEAGIDFAHHSNGALYRPNKGANYVGPFVGLRYTPEPSTGSQPCGKTPLNTAPDKRLHRLYLELSAGLGAKTLNEDWQNTQFSLPASAPNYRTGKFSVYGAFSLQTDLMYRYARRWATGVGVDVFYGDYASKVERIENATQASPRRVSPWSAAIAVKHVAFFGRLSARVGIGYYLYRHMGTSAREVEQRYYERVGLFYTLDKHSGLSLGISVNAHKTKADFTELQVALPIYL